jgi:hypothetical protein
VFDPVLNSAEDLPAIRFEHHEMPVAVNAVINQAQLLRRAASLLEKCDGGGISRRRERTFGGDDVK